jgi:hypothetical protein
MWSITTGIMGSGLAVRVAGGVIAGVVWRVAAGATVQAADIRRIRGTANRNDG